MAQTAIVTGSGQGIGKGIALQLAKDGFNIVVADLNEITAADTVKEVEALGVKALAVVTNVADETSVKNLIAAANEHFGSVDVLVNNAGIAQVGTIEEESAEDFDKISRSTSIVCSMVLRLRPLSCGHKDTARLSMPARLQVILGWNYSDLTPQPSLRFAA